MVSDAPFCAECGAVTRMCNSITADAELGAKHNASDPFYDLTYFCININLY